MPKKVVTQTSNRPCFRTSFANQRLHEFQTPLKSTPSHYYLIFPLIWDKKSWKTPALVRIESLAPFFNTLAAENKYSRRYMQNFQQQLQTALSQKQKIFSAIFIAFIKPTLNLEHFDKKMWVS